MKYTGNLCQGCQEPFSDNDDVVVCPECGTPQHRECYDKENRCVCSHLHGEDYAWQGTVIHQEDAPREKSETIACPNCGHENPKGTTVCRQCGMKFTLFGMNVVDAMHEQEQKAANPNRDIPSYDAPFKLGEGEAFEEKAPEDMKPTVEEVEQLITNVLSGNAATGANEDSRINLGGPFPATDETCGVLTNNVGNFVGTNGMKYISFFKKLQNGKKLSFNFAAFFFAPFWFFYRKLYKAGIVAMTVFVSMEIIMAPYIYKVLEVYEQLAGTLQSENVTMDEINAFYLQLAEASTPLGVYFLVALFIKLICGFIANPLYKKYVVEHVRTAERLPAKNVAMSYVIKFGGASVLFGILSYFAYQLIITVVSTFL